jgi:hypothetical protein
VAIYFNILGEIIMANETKQYFSKTTTVVNTAKVTALTLSQDEKYYFAKVSFLTGKDRWQHTTLLVDSRLKSFAKRVLDGEQELDEINPCSVEINDLHFTTKANLRDADKPYLNNQGVLSKISKAVF